MKNKYHGTLAAGHEVAWSQIEMYFTFKIRESRLNPSGKENRSLAEKQQVQTLNTQPQQEVPCIYEQILDKLR